MEDDLRQLLQEWEVEEEYIENFNRLKIRRASTLRLLKTSSLEKLFPDEGPLLEFEKHLNRYIKMSEAQSDENGNKVGVASTNVVQQNVSIVDILPDVLMEGDDLLEADKESSTSTPKSTSRPDSDKESSASTSKSTPRRPVSTNQIISPTDVNFNLEEVLKSSVNGQCVLAYFKSNSKLDYKSRCLLGDVLISHYLRDDSYKKLPYDVEKAMTGHIRNLFSLEKKETWQSPKQCGREKASGRGLLVTRYYAMRRVMLKNNLIQRNPNCGQDTHHENEETADDFTMEEQEAFNDSILWLQNNKQPWTRVQELWEETSKFRLSKLTNSREEVHDYVAKYPPLNEQSGYLLLEMDFEQLYPNSVMKLYMEWPMLEGFIKSKVNRKVKDKIESALVPEGRKICVLRALAYLFPVCTSIKKGKKQWRPSHLECQDALIMHVTVDGDVRPALEARKKKYKDYSLPFSPIAVMVGQDEDNITSSYICVNNFLYDVENPIKALDITFKALHSLDAAYNKEVTRECLFLQKAIYGIPLKDGQRMDTHTSDLVDEYEAFKSS